MNAPVEAMSEGTDVAEFVKETGIKDVDRLHGFERVERNDLARRPWQSEAPHSEPTVGSRWSPNT